MSLRLDAGSQPWPPLFNIIANESWPKLLSEYTAEKIEQVKKFGYLVSIITTDAKCHMEISDRRRDILKEERSSERKTRQKSEETATNAMECHIVWITDMGYEKRRYKKTGGFGNVNTEKKGKSQLD